MFFSNIYKVFFSLGLELFRFSQFKNDTLSEMFSAMEVFAVSTLRKKAFPVASVSKMFFSFEPQLTQILLFSAIPISESSKVTV